MEPIYLMLSENVYPAGFPQSWKILENPGKKVVMESYGKVMENSKNSEFHGNLFARKKSHGKVMEISCPNPPNRVPIVL